MNTNCDRYVSQRFEKFVSFTYSSSEDSSEPAESSSSGFSATCFSPFMNKKTVIYFHFTVALVMSWYAVYTFAGFL